MSERCASSRSAPARRDRAMHGARTSLGVCSLAAKEQSVAHGPRQLRRCVLPAYGLIAVRAASEGIVLPIVHPRRLDHRLVPVPR